MTTGSNLPLSEQYRIVAKQWVDQDNAATILEETKSSVLAEMKAELIKADPNLADNAADRMVRATKEWREWVINMVNQRTMANRLRMQLKYIEMRHSEHQSFEATKRAE